MATITVTANPGTNPYVNVALASFVESSVTVVRIDDLGNEVLVRNGDPLTLTAGAGTIQDYECPLDVNQHWEARNVSSGATIATSSTVQLASGGKVYLGHPGKPSLNMQVTIANWTPGGRRSRSSTFDIIDKTLPVARSFRRAGHAGSVQVRCDTFAQLDQLNSILDDGFPLIIRAPGNPSWGIGTRYLSVGDTDEEMRVRTPTRPRRWVLLPWTEIQRPAGLAQAGPGFAWSDVIASYATWADATAANPTWADILNGVP